jgi:hypothetical protein
MNPDDIPVAVPVYLFLIAAIEWLTPIVHLAGLAIACWAFRRCRRGGYLLIGFYFFLVLFSLLAMPSINQVIQERRTPVVSEHTRQKIDSAVKEAVDRVLEEEGHTTTVAERNIRFPFGPIVLVAGLWLVARRDVKGDHSRQVGPS